MHSTPPLIYSSSVVAWGDESGCRCFLRCIPHSSLDEALDVMPPLFARPLIYRGIWRGVFLLGGTVQYCKTKSSPPVNLQFIRYSVL